MPQHPLRDPRPPELPAALRERVFASVNASPSPDARDARRRHRVWLIASSALALGIFFTVGGPRVQGRPFALVLSTAFSAVVIGAGALALAAGRGRFLTGRPRHHLWALVPGVPLAYLVCKVASSRAFPHMSEPWADRAGWRCLIISLSVSIPWLTALLCVRKGSDPVHPTTSAAALGIAAGGCGAVLVDLWCPVAYVPHLLLGHVLPMMLLAALGGVLGDRLLALPTVAVSNRADRPR